MKKVKLVGLNVPVGRGDGAYSFAIGWGDDVKTEVTTKVYSSDGELLEERTDETIAWVQEGSRGFDLERRGNTEQVTGSRNAGSILPLASSLLKAVIDKNKREESRILNALYPILKGEFDKAQSSARRESLV